MLAEKIGKAPDGAIGAEEGRRLLDATEAAITTQVYPVYAEMIAYYEELRPKTTGNHGAWALPDGDAALLQDAMSDEDYQTFLELLGL